MTVNLQNSGKIIIIDDKEEEALPIIKALSKIGIPAVYFNGNIEYLPEEPFPDVRILFLDIVLGGLSGRDEKSILSYITNLIEKIVSKNNGPFILFIWSVHEEYAEKIIEKLLTLGYKPIPVLLEKNEYFDTSGGIIEKYKENDLLMIKTILKKINDAFQKNYSFTILMEWENIIHGSAGEAFNIISGLKKFDENWNKNLIGIIYKLARAQAGKTLDTNNPDEVIRNAFYSLRTLFEDILDTNIRRTAQFQVSIPPEEQTRDRDDDMIGEINSRLLLDREHVKGFFPGNVYLEDEVKIQLHDEKPLGTLLKEKISSDKHEYFTDLKNRVINSIKKKSKAIYVEITPICDFAQNKTKRAKILPGLLVPHKVKIEVTRQGKTEEETIDLSEKVRKRAYYLYISPIIRYKGENYLLVLDFRYITSIEKSKLENKQPAFRIRKELLNDIQHKASFHMSRPGLLSLSP